MSEQTNRTNWADPAPAGLVAMAISSFLFFALYSGRVDESAAPLLGVWLLGGFVVQLAVGLIELKRGSLLGGNVFLFFSAFFMLVTGVELLFKFWMTQSGILLDARIDGWAWLVLAIVLLTWTPAYLKHTSAIQALITLCLDVAVPFIAIRDLGLLGAGAAYAVASQIIAYSLLLAGIFGLYLAAATILNQLMGRTYLKVPGPLFRERPVRKLPAVTAE